MNQQPPDGKYRYPPFRQTPSQDHGHNWCSPSVLLYIDNSNIFESAKKHSSHKKGYRSGIPDVACRVDIGKLIAKAVGNRGLLFGKLYGSEPPALETVWEAIRRKQVQVETFQRSKWTLKEKETDASLTADAVEDIIVQKDFAGDNRTVILFSGDRDLFRVVEKAITYGYRVEIWSFKSSINNMVKKRAMAEPGRVFVNSIDDIFDEITYTKVVWGKKKIPPERSVVASIRLPALGDKRKILRDVVAKAGEIFRLPMMGKYMENYKYIVLVPCIKEQYVPQPCHGKPRHEQLAKRTYDFYKQIQPFTHQLEEYFDFCTGIKTWLEFISDRNGLNSPGFVSQSRFQLLPRQDDNDTNDKENEVGMLSDDESEDFDCNDFYDAHNTDLSDADDGFVPLVRKEVKPRRMYSAYCAFKFWCSKGFECYYKHTAQEKEFFKVQPDAGRRRLYKIKACYFLFAESPSKRCQYSDKPYLCPYAHKLEESRCICCKEKGSGKHWMDQCPASRTA